MNQQIFFLPYQIFSSVYGSGAYNSSTYNGSQTTSTGSSTGSATTTTATLQVTLVDNNPIGTSGTINNVSDEPIISGTAPPYSKVVVTFHSNPVLCTTTANAQGQWSCKLSQALPFGLHNVYVQATTPSGQVLTYPAFQINVTTSATTTQNTSTIQPSKSSSVPSTSHGTSTAEVILFIVIALVLIAGAFLLIMAMLKRRKNNQPPAAPTITPSSSPTP